MSSICVNEDDDDDVVLDGRTATDRDVSDSHSPFIVVVVVDRVEQSASWRDSTRLDIDEVQLFPAGFTPVHRFHTTFKSTQQILFGVFTLRLEVSKSKHLYDGVRITETPQHSRRKK